MFTVCCEAHMTKVSRNANMAKLQAGYLFPEVCDALAFIFCNALIYY